MVSLEQSEANIQITNEIINKQEVDLIVKLLREQKTHLEDKTELGNQMEKIIKLLEKDPNIPKVYGKMNLEIAMVQQDMIKVMIGVFKKELTRIKSDLEKDDIQSSSAASELLSLLSDNKTLEAFSVSGKASVTDYLSSLKNGTLWCEVVIALSSVRGLRDGHLCYCRRMTARAGVWRMVSTSPVRSSPTLAMDGELQ